MTKQELQVLNYLRNHEGMTTHDANNEWILSPAKRIEELRNEGYNIETVYKRSGTGRRYGMYVLHEGGEPNANEQNDSQQS